MRVPDAGDKCVSVGRRVGDAAGPDVAVRATDILNDDGLTKRRPHSLGQDARDDVGKGARGERHDHRNSLRRIGLRPSEARRGWKRGRARGQMQKISAGKFHFEPPSHHSITSSATASSDIGTVRPSVFAVLRLMTSSNFVGCITGRSAGLAPLRIRPTYMPTWRYASVILVA